MSTTNQMIFALILGVATGLFFGEMVGWMNHIGTAVILLMQMTVFPYIVTSLVGGIGKLDRHEAATLFSKASVIMAVLWLVGLVVIFLIPVMFPSVDSASFFSTSTVEEPPEVDYFKLYIPANPFESMAAGAVPAMVLFSIATGLALISMKEKTAILSFMDTASEALAKITHGLLKVLPVGIFALSASASGTLGVEEFASLQVYLVSMLILCCLLCFWVLPWIVHALLPVRYRDVVRVSRSAIVTAFATGNIFITLPVIVEECKKILAEKTELDDDTANLIDILVPVAYSFPNIGKLTVILFVLFAAWFDGKALDLTAMPSLGMSGLFALFGSVYVAIPFMLNLMQVPVDLFQFFVVSGFITGRLGSMVAVMNLFVLTLLSIGLIKGLLRTGVRSWLRLGAGAAVVVVVLAGGRVAMEYFVDRDTQTSEVIANMRVSDHVPISVTRQYPVEGETPRRALAGTDEVRRRGLLRVGYRPSNVPFSYYNNANELVGFDVAMAETLANGLGVAIEFVPFERGTIADGLDNGYFDIAMSGLAMDAEIMREIAFSRPVLELNRALVAPDHMVESVDSLEEILGLDHLAVAYVEHDKLIVEAKKKLPNLEFESIENYLDFFLSVDEEQDVLFTSAQAAHAWTLFFPDYGVAVYSRDEKYPASYAVARDNADLLRYVDNWVDLMRVDGTTTQHYDRWILGEGTAPAGSRWSIVKDVLGWVEG